MSSPNNRVLVIAAHPDDPEFLAGGTIGRLAKEGGEVSYVILTNGNKGSGDPILKLFLSRIDDLIARVSKKTH